MCAMHGPPLLQRGTTQRQSHHRHEGTCSLNKGGENAWPEHVDVASEAEQGTTHCEQPDDAHQAKIRRWRRVVGGRGCHDLSSLVRCIGAGNDTTFCRRALSRAGPDGFRQRPSVGLEVRLRLRLPLAAPPPRCPAAASANGYRQRALGMGAPRRLSVYAGASSLLILPTINERNAVLVNLAPESLVDLLEQYIHRAGYHP